MVWVWETVCGRWGGSQEDSEEADSGEQSGEQGGWDQGGGHGGVEVGSCGSVLKVEPAGQAGSKSYPCVIQNPKCGAHSGGQDPQLLSVLYPL